MNGGVHISEAARRLGVTPEYLRALERRGRIPLARRDLNGRTYTSLDIAVLRAMGIGSRPKRLRRPEEVFEAAR
jgi:DNA-binding transcriptional MerR regulator